MFSYVSGLMENEFWFHFSSMHGKARKKKKTKQEKRNKERKKGERKEERKEKQSQHNFQPVLVRHVTHTALDCSRTFFQGTFWRRETFPHQASNCSGQEKSTKFKLGYNLTNFVLSFELENGVVLYTFCLFAFCSVFEKR